MNDITTTPPDSKDRKHGILSSYTTKFDLNVSSTVTIKHGIHKTLELYGSTIIIPRRRIKWVKHENTHDDRRYYLNSSQIRLLKKYDIKIYKPQF
jgi:hypothetical protein